MNPYYEDDFHCIRVDQDAGCVHYKATGQARDSHHFRNGLLKMIDILHTRKSEVKRMNYLADVSEVHFVSDQDDLWLTEVFLPMLYSKGIRKVAVVLSPDVFPQIAMDQIATTEFTKYKFCYIRMFDKMEEARNWLRNFILTNNDDNHYK